MAERRRVVVTGIGPVTPIGTGVDAFWDALVAGRSGIGPITQFDATEYASKIAGSVADFDAEDYLDPRQARRLARFSQFAVVGSVLALEDAGVKPSDLDRERVGVAVGTGIGGMGLAENEYRVLLEKGPRRVNPGVLSMLIPNAAAGHIAIEFGFTGPNECTVTACAAGGQALARGVDFIRSRAADVVVVAGTEACVTPFSVASFAAGRALSTRNDDPQGASRPFDANRDGFVLAEGATVLVIEALEVAEARGARIRAEIRGYGLAADAYNMTAPHPEGAGGLAAMRAALADADLQPTDVDYVNAHATATPLGDVVEAMAIRTLFGVSTPPTSATKSMTGHMLGAAGTTEAAATVLAIQHGILPPTINYDTPDPECAIDVVPNVARKAKVRAALSNSFGFGGHNVSIAFSRAP